MKEYDYDVVDDKDSIAASVKGYLEEDETYGLKYTDDGVVIEKVSEEERSMLDQMFVEPFE